MKVSVIHIRARSAGVMQGIVKITGFWGRGWMDGCGMIDWLVFFQTSLLLLTILSFLFLKVYCLNHLENISNRIFYQLLLRAAALARALPQRFRQFGFDAKFFL